MLQVYNDECSQYVMKGYCKSVMYLVLRSPLLHQDVSFRLTKCRQLLPGRSRSCAKHPHTYSDHKLILHEWWVCCVRERKTSSVDILGCALRKAANTFLWARILA